MKKRWIAASLCAALVLGGCGAEEQEQPAEEQPAVQEEAGSDAEKMTEELKALPREITPETAAEQGFFTIDKGAVTSGREKWDAFKEAVDKGEEASVIICQYTEAGEAALDYLMYRKEGGFQLVSDASRIGEKTDRPDYEAEQYECLNIFEDFSMEEGGAAYTIGVLSNEPELDEDTFRTYWREMSIDAHQILLLFVI